MKRLLALLMLATFLTFSGCVTTTPPGSTDTNISILSESQVVAAQKTLLALGAGLKSAPVVLDTLYTAGKISKEDYNNAVSVYNKSLSSWKLAVTYLKIGSTSSTYNEAFAGFLINLSELNQLIIQLSGGK